MPAPKIVELLANFTLKCNLTLSALKGKGPMQ